MLRWLRARKVILLIHNARNMKGAAACPVLKIRWAMVSWVTARLCRPVCLGSVETSLMALGSAHLKAAQDAEVFSGHPCAGLCPASRRRATQDLGWQCGCMPSSHEACSRKVTECPFSDEVLSAGRELVFLVLELAGTKLPVRERPDGQPFFLAAIEELLRVSGDPDSAAFYASADSFAKCARLGVDVALPRAPAVFEEILRHRKCGEDAEWHHVDRTN